MYSFDLVFAEGGENHLYDTTKARNGSKAAFAVRVVPILDTGAGQSARLAYVDLSCSYEQRQVLGGYPAEILTTQSEFAIDGPGIFPFDGEVSGPSKMIEPELLGGVDGYTYRVWVAEEAGENIRGDLSTYAGLSPTPAGGGTFPLEFLGPYAPDANDPPADSADDGISLVGVTAISVGAEVAFPSTIDADTGTLQAWIRRAELTYWARAPELDLAVGGAGVRAIAWPSAPVPISSGRLVYLPSGMSITGGGTEVFISIQEAKS